MAAPYEIEPNGGLVCPGGVATCHAIRHPSRANISKIVVKQTAGTLAMFDIAIFNHESVCAGDSLSDSDDSPPGTAKGPTPADCYRVTPDITSDAPGTLMYFSNQDGRAGGSFPFVGMTPDRLGKSRILYIRITPTGADPANEFAVALGGEAYEA